MTMTVGLHSTHEPGETDGEDGPSDQEDDLPKSVDAAFRPPCSDDTLPSGVWFGPKGSEATERELIAFLGSHNGVAVLQWPRDAHRSERFFRLGIPCLWFVQDPADLPPVRGASEEWLPRTASDLDIHESLRRLCAWSATERSAAWPELEENGWLHLGEHGIQLTPPETCLAAPLVAHFGEAVDDELLTRRPARPEPRRNGPFVSGLDHLNREVNGLGLEVVPATDRTHLIRRCR